MGRAAARSLGTYDRAGPPLRARCLVGRRLQGMALRRATFWAGGSVSMQSHSSGPSNTIHHASSGELIDIRLFKNNLKTTAIKALFKSNHLEVSRTVLFAGKDVPPHQVAGEMTVQCLEGV